MEHLAKIHSHLVAHRGYAAAFPENSLSAFQAAVDCGCESLELDVQLTKDKVPVIIHDDNLQRTGSQNIKIFETPWKQIKDFSIGEQERFGHSFDQEKILSLHDFSQWVKQYPHVKVFVEVKEESINYFGSKVVLDSLLKVVESIKQQCVIISFDAPFLLHVKKHSGFPIGFVLHTYDDKTRQIAEQMQPEVLICNYKKIPDEDDALWQGSWDWFLYEICEHDLARKWLNRGVSYIETMEVKPMMAALANAS